MHTSRWLIGGATIAVLWVCVATSQAQWLPVGGPEGGEVRVLATLDDTIWGGTPAGIHFSADGGETWQFSDLPLVPFRCLLAANGTLFAGASGRGCWRRESSGDWARLTGPWKSSSTAYSLATWRDRLFVAMYDSLYWSDDNGDTWARCDSLPATTGLQSLAAHRDFLLAVGYPGLYTSADSGATWEACTTGLGVSASKVYAVDTVIFVVSSSGYRRSVDNGQSWSACTGPSGTMNGVALGSFGDTVFVTAQSQGVLRSLDLGETWTLALDDRTVGSDHALLCTGDDVVVTWAQSMYVSGDGGETWDPPTREVVATDVADLFQVGDTILAPFWRGWMGRTTADGSATWVKENTSLEGPKAMAWYKDLLVGLAYSTPYYSPDSGHTWSPFPGFSGHANALLALDSAMYTGSASNGVLRSLDDGTTWDSLNDGLPSRDVRALVDCDGGVLAAVLSQGIYRLEGNAWVDANTGIALPESQRQFESFVVADTLIYAASQNSSTDPAIYVSSDCGVTWTAPYSGRGPGGCSALWMVDTIFVGVFNYSEVLASGDRGATWVDVSQGIPQQCLQHLLLVGDTLWGSIAYRGVWKRPLSEIADVVAASQVSFSRPAASAGWQGTRNGTWEVFDARGRLVRSIPGFVSADRRVLTVGLASGTYVIRQRSASAGARCIVSP